MKVLLANNYFYLRGGCERVMFDDMRALTDKGVDIVPFSAVDPANVPSEYSSYFACGVDIHATNPLRQLQAARETIHCTRTAEAFAKLIDKTQPDVVHFHNIYGRLTTSILGVARRLGLPAVLTAHDYKVACPSYLMLRDGKPCMSCVDGGYYRCAIHRCHKQNLATSVVSAAEAYYARFADSYGAASTFLCPSLFMSDVLIRSGIDAGRVMYHPNSVDPFAYTPCYEGEYVLYAGRLSQEKGLPTLVQAMLGTGIPLKIAGAGPMEEQLRATVATKDSGSSITFEGHCDGVRLAALYRNAAFVVVPSEWYENAPMSILEAFAYGKPVVGSRIGGIPELISEGENGHLVESSAPEQLRTAISQLWSDGKARASMGRNARRLVETKFSQNTRTAALLSIYDTLFRPRQSGAWLAGTNAGSRADQPSFVSSDVS
jgi:glycosyltransferase involved in cell wall biosynthesis